MKRFIPFMMLLMTAAPANADLIHRLTSSTQLSVDGAATAATRVGSTYAVSGTNVDVSSANNAAFGGLTVGSATAAATMKTGTYDVVTTDGSAFSFSESYTQGDAINAIGTGVDVTSGVVADMPAFGITTTQSGGVAGTLAGTIKSSGAITVVGGGAGTTATGQFVSEVTVR
jgi:hypothetical protein